jgi:hypothetical protein
MGAEIYDVTVTLEAENPKSTVIAYATKVSNSKNKDNSTKLTFNGDVTIGGRNTGGTISIENLYWPEDLDKALELENMLNAEFIKSITCVGNGYTRNGTPYKRVITGTEVTITSDEEEWSPSDGITNTLEVSVNQLKRESKRA